MNNTNKLNKETKCYCYRCCSELTVSVDYQHYIGEQAYIVCSNCKELLDLSLITFKEHYNWEGFLPYD